jgi:hypothetical protein
MMLILLLLSVDEGRGKNYYGNLLDSGYVFGGGPDGIMKKATHKNGNVTNVLIEKLDAR